jgi:hypothetical protein
MRASQRAFFSEILDYAGLFPPAQLPLDKSIGNYLRYRGEPESWLLARFICPAGRLHELRPYVRQHVNGPAPLRLSTLAQGGHAPGAFLDNLRGDLKAIAEFSDELGSAVALECLEMRLPTSLPGSGTGNPEWLLTMVSDALAVEGLAALSRFYELPATADWHRVADTLAASSQETAAETPEVSGGRGVAGLKLRCGGLEPAAVPSVAQVASALGACLASNVPLKFTAGLHHPVRRFDSALGGHVHGFLNLFAAGILGAALGLEHHDLMALIEEEDVHQFTFSNDYFAWRGAEVTVSEIAHARRRHVISFGSCSFDEPRDGLRELGYI